MPTRTDHVDSEVVCRIAREVGLDAVGVATAEPFAEVRAELERRRSLGLHAGMQFTYRNPERSTDPGMTVEGARSLVVGALRYDHRRSPPPRCRGTMARVGAVAWSDRYAALRAALGEVAGHLRGAGWSAVVAADDNSLVDRAAAQRAGLGWYGKSANLLLPGRGSWFVLGAVITDAPLAPTGSALEDGCGSCARCIRACPTDAIVAPGVVDATRCLAWLLEAPGVIPRRHRSTLGDRIYGCDDCQEVCPPNLRLDRDDPEPPPEQLGAWVDLVGVVEAPAEELLERLGHWYIPGRDPDHLRRNALVALGNTADPSDARVQRVLRGALGHPSAIVRSHALWAARRLGLRELEELLAGERDPIVLSELAAGEGA